VNLLPLLIVSRNKLPILVHPRPFIGSYQSIHTNCGGGGIDSLWNRERESQTCPHPLLHIQSDTAAQRPHLLTENFKEHLVCGIVNIVIPKKCFHLVRNHGNVQNAIKQCIRCHLKNARWIHFVLVVVGIHCWAVAAVRHSWNVGVVYRFQCVWWKFWSDGVYWCAVGIYYHGETSR